MSAPLVVNTRDGVCWTRRAVTSAGIVLYAPESVRTCPEFVMATLAELAEQGIVGSADVLPVPVGPEPQAPGVLAEASALIGGAKPATDRLLVQIAGSLRDVREHEHPTWEDLFCQNLTQWMGERMGLVLRRLLDAEARVAELEEEKRLLPSRERDELQTRFERALAPFCADPRAAAVAVGRVRDHEAVFLLRDAQRVQDRVIALEAERHSTNEALDDAVQELRARGRESRKVFAERAREGSSGARTVYRMLAEDVADGEHYPAVHHDYRVGHDLPETGGA